MFEAYRIGVAIHLTNHVSGALASLARDFAKTDEQAALLQKRLDSISRGMKAGLIAGGAGLALAAAFKPAIDEAMKFERAMLRLKDIGGIDANVVMRVRNDALSGKYKGIGAAESVDLVRDLHAAFGDAKEALEFIPLFAGMARVTQGKYGKSAVAGEEDVKALGRVAERRGGTKSPQAMESALDLAMRIQNASGGAVTPKDLLSFMNRMGAMGIGMSNDGIMKMWALMQEQGGSKAGTALNSAMQNLLNGRGTEDSGSLLRKIGWVDEEANRSHLKERFGADWEKHQNKVTRNSLKNADEAKADMVGWVMSTGLPLISQYLDKQRILDPKKRESETVSILAQALSNRLGADSIALIATQLPRIMKDYHIAQSSKGLRETVEDYDKNPVAKLQKLHADWETALTNLGEAALPVVIPLVNRLSRAFKEFNEYAEKNPDTVKSLVKGLATLSGILIGLGGMTVFVNGMRAIGVVIELLSGPAGLAAVRIGLRGLLGPIGLLITAFEVITWWGDKLKKANVKSTMEEANPDYHKPNVPSAVDAANNARTAKGEALRKKMQQDYALEHHAASYSHEGRNSVVPPPSNAQTRAINNTIVMPNGEVLARVVTQHQVKSLARPQVGPSTFDGSMNPRALGSSSAG